MSLMLALLLAVPQNTWVVDRNNGPGTNFTDLPPAVAAAAHGDTILVRGGTTTISSGYSPFQVTGKALTIRGVGMASTFLSNVPGGYSISSVPPGTVFHLEGVSIGRLNLTGGILSVSHCQILGGNSFVSGVLAAADCMFFGGVVINSNSTLVATRCYFIGLTAFVGLCGGSASGTPGVTATNSAVFLHSCSVQGGRNAHRDPFGSCANWESSVEGVRLIRSTLRISGEPSNVIAAGMPSPPDQSFGAPGVSADAASSVLVHGSVTIQSYGLIPPISGPFTLGAPPLPRLSVTGTAQANGEIVTANPVTVAVVSALPNAPLVLGFTTTPPTPIDLSPFALGEVMLPLSVYFLSAATDGAGQFQVTFPGVLVPWIGQPVFGQAGVLDVAANQVRTSNLELSLFRP